MNGSNRAASDNDSRMNNSKLRKGKRNIEGGVARADAAAVAGGEDVAIA